MFRSKEQVSLGVSVDFSTTFFSFCIRVGELPAPRVVRVSVHEIPQLAYGFLVSDSEVGFRVELMDWVASLSVEYELIYVYIHDLLF